MDEIAEVVSFGVFRVNLSTREIWQKDRLLGDIQEQSRSLLIALLKHGNSWVSYDQLMKDVWPGQVVQHKNLHTAVYNLKRALGGLDCVQNDNKRAYRFILALSIERLTDLAAPYVREMLNRVGNRHALAIDEAVCFYLPPSDIQECALTKTSRATRDVLSADLANPPRAVLERLVQEQQPDNIREHLKTRITDEKAGRAFWAKVGLKKIILPVPRIGQPLTLMVEPLSFWVEREFNRCILTNANDARLMQIYHESLLSVLAPSEDVAFPCPSALYLEVAIVTKNKKFLLIEKNPGLSTLATARGRPLWSCSIEEGLIWKRDGVAEMATLRTVLNSCLKEELKVESDSVRDFRVFALALECSHLNSAFIGYCQLDLTPDELIPRIKKSPDFGLGYQFVDVGQAQVDEVWAKYPSALDWHPTGRLRMHLTLQALQEQGGDQSRSAAKA